MARIIDQSSSASRLASSVALPMPLFCLFVVHTVSCSSVLRPLCVFPSLILPFSHWYWSLHSSMQTIFSFRFGLFLFFGILLLRRRIEAFPPAQAVARWPSSFPRQSILDPVRFTAAFHAQASLRHAQQRPSSPLYCLNPCYIVLF